MSVTYKDIDDLSQKATIAGTEKLPVSDTEFITPNQIAGLVETEEHPARDSSKLITAGGVLNYCLLAGPMTPASTVTSKYLARSGNEVSSDTYSYRKYDITPGEVYSVTSVTAGNFDTGFVRIALWLDSNDAVLSYEDYGNTKNQTTRFYDVPVVAPAGAAKLAVNYRTGFDVSGAVKHLSPPNPVCLIKNAQTLTSAEQAQARTNIGAGTSSFSGNYSDLSGAPTTILTYTVSDFSQPTSAELTGAYTASVTAISSGKIPIIVLTNGDASFPMQLIYYDSDAGEVIYSAHWWENIFYDLDLLSDGTVEMYENSLQKSITISSSEPTSQDGSDGDIWIVI